MNKLYLSLTVLFTILVTDLRAQNIVFNDNAFKQELLSGTDALLHGKTNSKNLNDEYFNIDTNNDGEISQAEALKVTSLKFAQNSGVTDMTEIKYFTNLIDLDISGTDAETIDISDLIQLKIFDSNQELTSLDVSENSNLETLIISHSEISSIDLSTNTKLTVFNSLAASITQLDLTKQVDLQVANIQNMEQLNSLTLGNKPQLHTLYVHTNPNLTQLDVSQATNLTTLECHFIAAKKLDLNNNHKLTTLKCASYHLETLLFKNENRTASFFSSTLSFDSPELTYVCVNENEIDFFKSKVQNPDSVTVFDSQCDQDLSTPTFDFNQELTLSPNPAQDQINIQSHNGAAVESVNIFNLQGQQVLQSNQTTIDINQLDAGVYIVNIVTDKGTTTTKFVKL